MSSRTSRDRKRIPLRCISTRDDLYTTFSKRRIGLYKKASELSTLCGVDVGIIIFSPTNNPYSFWQPSVDSVIEQYKNPYQSLDDGAKANTRSRIEYLNMQLDEVLDEKEHFNKREKQIDESGWTRTKGWWEEIPVESLSKKQVREWKVWFKDLKSKVKNHIDELKSGASSYSFPFQLYNAPNFPVPTMFHQVFPQDQSYEPSMRIIRPSRFVGHYYNVPHQAPLSFYGGGTSHVPGHYHGLPESLYGSMHGGISFPFPGLLNYTQALNASIGGTGDEEASSGGIGESSKCNLRDINP